MLGFSVEGLDDDEVCIGDRYAIGTAVFEVTQPLLNTLLLMVVAFLPFATSVLPALGVAVIAAFNAYYWLPIRGETSGPAP